MRPSLLLTMTIATLLLAACGDSKFKSMSDAELADRHANCLDNKPSAPGKAQACENFRRECERRKEAGHYICRTY